MRVDNWPGHFSQVIEAYKHKDFVWGETDCVCFAADCIKAITGFDFLKDYRGIYNDEEGALRLIAQHGGLEEGLGKLLLPVTSGVRPSSVSAPCVNVVCGHAVRGDLVILDMNGKLSCGIWIGRCALAPMPDRGLCEVPREFVKTCWGIT